MKPGFLQGRGRKRADLTRTRVKQTGNWQRRLNQASKRPGVVAHEGHRGKEKKKQREE